MRGRCRVLFAHSQARPDSTAGLLRIGREGRCAALANALGDLPSAQPVVDAIEAGLELLAALLDGAAGVEQCGVVRVHGPGYLLGHALVDVIDVAESKCH